MSACMAHRPSPTWHCPHPSLSCLARSPCTHQHPSSLPLPTQHEGTPPLVYPHTVIVETSLNPTPPPWPQYIASPSCIDCRDSCSAPGYPFYRVTMRHCPSLDRAAPWPNWVTKVVKVRTLWPNRRGWTTIDGLGEVEDDASRHGEAACH
jgi:hypothetical protein